MRRYGKRIRPGAHCCCVPATPGSGASAGVHATQPSPLGCTPKRIRRYGRRPRRVFVRSPVVVFRESCGASPGLRLFSESVPHKKPTEIPRPRVPTQSVAIPAEQPSHLKWRFQRAAGADFEENPMKSAILGSKTLAALTSPLQYNQSMACHGTGHGAGEMGGWGSALRG